MLGNTRFAANLLNSVYPLRTLAVVALARLTTEHAHKQYFWRSPLTNSNRRPSSNEAGSAGKGREPRARKSRKEKSPEDE
jgi:hypothetical protein